MIYISAQPDAIYFHWQVELYITNFLRIGIEPAKIQVLFLYSGVPSENGRAIGLKYPGVNVFFYDDDRPDQSYAPSVKPFALFKHLQKFPGMNMEAIFYHDSDMIFRERIEESLFEQDDLWYCSNTISYIGYRYVYSKGAQQFFDMVDLVRVGMEAVRMNQHAAGGAQYIVKNTTAAFWYKVYEDSHRLYWLMDRYATGENVYEGQYPIQKWCAEMWATIWNAWFFKHVTIVHKHLDFCMAPDPLHRWNETRIMHNAGITGSGEFFFKDDYKSKYPFSEKFTIKADSCSFMYVAEFEYYKPSNPVLEGSPDLA